MHDDVQKDVQIHIHEHVGPLRERVSKLEGRLDVHDRELSLLRQGLDSLRDRIDQTREAVLDAISTHAANEVGKHDAVDKRISCLAEAAAETKEQIRSVKAWIVGIGLGAGSVIAALTLLEKFGVFHR